MPSGPSRVLSSDGDLDEPLRRGGYNQVGHPSIASRRQAVSRDAASRSAAVTRTKEAT